MSKKLIVGVSACPTGIAHTYMAAEALEQAIRNAGYDAKIETQGTKIENKLTQEDIDRADGIILAVDKRIDMGRFEGKEVFETSTKRAVAESSVIVQELISGKGVTKLEKGSKPQGSQKSGIYRHLMTGVNYMLPFVIAGGILIAISFAFGINASNPEHADYNKIAWAFSEIGGTVAFGLMVPVLAAGISYSIAGQQGILPGMVAGMLAKSGGSGFIGGVIGGMIAGYLVQILLDKLPIPKAFETLKGLIIIPLLSTAIIGFLMIFVIGTPVTALLNMLTDFLNSLSSTNGVVFGLLIGVMMASDMGGPINKAISTFAIGLMSTGVYGPIAACMAAGMTPPLGLALATVLFKDKFTVEEREAGKSCWILGASYITEGAIPFAVADPIRVIPSLMVGSAIAGAVSLAFNVTSLAPHGGIWVMLIPNVIGNMSMYALAIVLGTVATAVMVGFLKKPIEG